MIKFSQLGILGTVFFGVLLTPSCNQKKEVKKQPNVVLIYVDDLRPELGAYGIEGIKSPSIDAFAKDALVFNNAYATVPVCGASRASMLSGIIPNRNRFVDYDARTDTETPEAVVLPGFLKANGYQALSIGKVFHNSNDNAQAWSEKPFKALKFTDKDYASNKNIALAEANPRNRAGAFEMIDTTDEAYLDGKLAKYAMERLQETRDSSLFMAVGFHKPHLPFTAPKKYWEMYDREAIPFPSNYYIPKNAPEKSIHNFGELRSYTDIPDGKELLDSALVKKLVHGYYACVSYTDAQIGKFINQLKAQNLYDDAIIILVGDHGWFLGEHTMWSKHANYEKALRSAFMIKFPKSEKKGYTDLPIGLVELYPTLAEILGLEVPSHVQSESFLSLLDDPQAVNTKEVYCRFKDGETILKGKYAYTEYYNKEGDMYGNMLYNHEIDPQENVNIVSDVDPAIVTGLSADLMKYINTP